MLHWIAIITTNYYDSELSLEGNRPFTGCGASDASEKTFSASSDACR